ncbi:hypothetical protein AAVH_21557 [Aphelenchoides avenae]|nr:hypothetical protein AAVH_21557 [Aphelenchus avenae]
MRMYPRDDIDQEQVIDLYTSIRHERNVEDAVKVSVGTNTELTLYRAAVGRKLGTPLTTDEKFVDVFSNFADLETGDRNGTK